MSNCKRARPIEVSSPAKKPRTAPHGQPSSNFQPPRIATADAADAVHADLPLKRLLTAVKDGVKCPQKAACVVYWMRMADLRISDNRALSRASAQAKQDSIPLVVLFVLSPQDYIAHDRSPRRIDFVLRNLSIIKASLSDLNIPLHISTHIPRRTMPAHVVSQLTNLNATRLYANIEYELDELRRDISVCGMAKDRGISVEMTHDRCVVEPGIVQTKEGKTYTVYSPYLKNWVTNVNGSIPHYIGDCPKPQANKESIRAENRFKGMFDEPVPETVEGFELGEEDKSRMNEVWPAGEAAAKEILSRFLSTRSRSSQFASVSPLATGAEASTNRSRIRDYKDKRDQGDKDTTSRLSPYLSAGVISARECVRATMALSGAEKVDVGGTTGIGRWLQEVAWRDFYISILANFPRVSMGRPFNEKFADVVWESVNDSDSGPDTSSADEAKNKGKIIGFFETKDTKGQGNAPVEGGLADKPATNFERWKHGKTGYPIVDAAMRCANEMGWMHNRMRMITAMFLCKHLMLDWREGERYFMQILIDGDLASNNGGWQWCASTGTDACPYFRIFNPYSQSLKADPTGDFIRHYVPELSTLHGPDLHDPPAKVADKLGYPRPIVDHTEARQRALRRYKNPGKV